jgi:hypothetical protein
LSLVILFNIALIENSLIICRILPKYLEIVNAVDEASQWYLLPIPGEYLSGLDARYPTENSRQAVESFLNEGIQCTADAEGIGVPHRHMVAAQEMPSLCTVSILPEGTPFQRGNALLP